MFQMMAHVKLQNVPYRGSAPALNDLVAGSVDCMFDNLGVSMQLVKAGKLKLIAVASPKRMASLPDVPAIAETLPGFAAVAWYAFVAPAGTPAAVVDKINAGVNEALHDPEIQKRLTDLSAEPVGGTPQDTAATSATRPSAGRTSSRPPTSRSIEDCHETQHRSDPHHPCRQPAAAAGPAQCSFERGGPKALDQAAAARGFDRRSATSCAEQAELGIDVIDDGEYGKPSFVSYINERLGGYEVDTRAGPRNQWMTSREGLSFPEFYAQTHPASTHTHMICTGPITYKGHAALKRDIDNLKARSTA